MALRNIYKVRPISDKARLQFAECMNNDPIAYIEDKRSDGRWFFSSKITQTFGFGQMVLTTRIGDMRKLYNY